MNVKKFSLIILSLLFFNYCHAQQGEWVWIHGSNTSGSFGNFGVKGVPSPTNEPPSLYEPCEWIDLNGNFWMFGGKNANYYFCCDLWKYDVATNEWTWMKGSGVLNQYDPGHYGTIGVASPANYPPSGGYALPTWVDNQGDLWLNTGPYNDMWRYNISTNMWACMRNDSVSAPVFGIQGVPGSLNHPGGGYERASTWSDSSGNLWLFGGQCYNFGMSDALWRYNIATGFWTWMKGSSTTYQPPVYGTLGVEDSSNTPGARFNYSHWKDSLERFWMFGGALDNTNIVAKNDFWRFNPATNNWTWLDGGSGGNSSGVYGTKCYASPANIPCARFENRAVYTDSNGNFWMFGGARGQGTFTKVWNDLWMYNISINQWVWVSGDSIYNPVGNWGTLGVSNPNNKPSGRGGAVMWGDNNGHLYVFGGSIDNPTAITPMNDLWKFTIDTVCMSISINEMNIQENEIEVFPNPTTGELTIIIHKDNLQKVEFTLTNFVGEKVFAQKENNIRTTRTKTIDMSKFSNGVYILEVMLDGKKIVRKVEKH